MLIVLTIYHQPHAHLILRSYIIGLNSTTEFSQNAMTEGFHTSPEQAVTQASRVNREAVIAGASVAATILLLLLFVSVIVVMLIVYSISKRKKCVARYTLVILYTLSRE
jgi:hypothetical protein